VARSFQAYGCVMATAEVTLPTRPYGRGLAKQRDQLQESFADVVDRWVSSRSNEDGIRNNKHDQNFGCPDFPVLSQVQIKLRYLETSIGQRTDIDYPTYYFYLKKKKKERKKKEKRKKKERKKKEKRKKKERKKKEKRKKKERKKKEKRISKLLYLFS
jgi:hypothetical protein